MKQVITKTGEPISGLFRSDSGSLVVDDPVRLMKMKKEQEKIQEIDELRTEVKEVKTTLSEILNILKGIRNG